MPDTRQQPNQDQAKRRISRVASPQGDLLPAKIIGQNLCCAPMNRGDTVTCIHQPIGKRGGVSFDISEIPGGEAILGTDRPLIELDEENPRRTKIIQPFRMMQTAVSNAMFKEFVDDTGYKTEAERLGWSYVFYQQLPENFKPTQALVAAQWWRKVHGACWNKICGPGVDHTLDPEHPVVHVSWHDANAFATWAGGRLPAEVEWEHAARGGLGDVPFPWGTQEPNDSDYQPCNIWQGDFPKTNLCEDGFAATAPVKSFEPNGFGLYNMCGNVWEWASGRLKITGRSDASRRHAKHYKGCKLLKGGSFLCHKSYCFRYRIAARSGTTPDSSTSHQGFRLVFS